MENTIRNTVYSDKDGLNLLTENKQEVFYNPTNLVPNQATTVENIRTVFFRKKNGNSWIVIARKEDEKIEGWIYTKDRKPTLVSLKGIPERLKLEDLKKAQSILKQSQFKITHYQIEVLLGLQGGMKKKEKGKTKSNVKVALEGNAKSDLLQSKNLFLSESDCDFQLNLNDRMLSTTEVVNLMDENDTLNTSAKRKKTIPSQEKIFKRARRYTKLAQESEADDDITDAEKNYEEAIKISADSEFYEPYGEFLIRTEKKVKAQTVLSELGKLYEKENQLEKAVENYKKLLQIKPEEEKTLESLIRVSYLLQDSEAVINYNLSLGNLYVSKNDLEKANKYYEEAFRIFKDIRAYDPNDLVLLKDYKHFLKVKHAPLAIINLTKENYIDKLHTYTISNGKYSNFSKKGPQFLLDAAQKGHIKMIKLMIGLGVDIHSTMQNNLTALHCAAFNGQTEAIVKLVELGAYLEAKDHEGRTALHYAGMNGEIEVITKLLELGSSLESQDNSGKTLLHYLAVKGKIEVVAKLLDLGVDLSNQDIEGKTVLHCLIENGKIEAVYELTKLGASLECTDKAGRRPLHYAAINRKAAMLAKLVELGANLEAKDHEGRTALHWAAGNGLLDRVEELIQLKACLEVQDHVGQTALHWAAGKGHANIVIKLNPSKFQLEIKDFVGRTALHWAALNGQPETVAKLIALGAFLEARDSAMNTALHWAAGNGHIETMFELIKLGANLEAKDNKGRTPLYLANLNGYVNAVKDNKYEAGKLYKKGDKV